MSNPVHRNDILKCNITLLKNLCRKKFGREITEIVMDKDDPIKGPTYNLVDNAGGTICQAWFGADGNPRFSPPNTP